MKRSVTLILLLTLIFGLSATTTTVDVGTVTGSNRYLPIHTGYSYNYTQQIYTQSQINLSGEITKIRFYHDHDGNLETAHDWVIYMGHVARDSFTSRLDWEPVSNLTQVFSGSVLSSLPPAGEWLEITLDTPFNYDNANNLLVAVHENTPSWGTTSYWGSFTSGSNTGLYYYHNGGDPDLGNLPYAHAMTDILAAAQLVFNADQPPLAPTLTMPENNASVMNGNALKWAQPPGSHAATSYDVYVDGVLASGEQTAAEYIIRGLADGTHTWYVVGRNSLGMSPPSETRSFEVGPGVVVGNGDLQSRLPLWPYYPYNYTQSIFLQPELDAANQGTQSTPMLIESLSYYFNGADSLFCSNDWVVYMGHTDRSEFAGTMDWVPTQAMEQVFAGHLTIPGVPGWIEVELDTPFVYNNIDNLVIAVDENTPWRDFDFPNHGRKHFLGTATPEQKRSLGCFGDYEENPDPNSPPIGNLFEAFPNLCLQFGELPTVPVLSVTPDTLNFGFVYHGVASAPLNLLVSNLGGGTIDLAAGDVTIIGADAADFSFDSSLLPTSLGPGQVLRLPVNVNSVVVGERTATLRIVYNGQNYDVELIAEILPPGTVIIGDGTLTQDVPFSTGYDYMRSATLYTADQIGAAGFIDMLAWDCAATSDNTIPYKIWVRNTDADQMEITRWQYLTAEMTMVHEGNYVPNTLGWNSFQLDLPFTYTGGNLIVAVEANYGSGTLSSQRYRYTEADAQVHQYWFNINSPPTGTGQLNNRMPNLMLHLHSHLAGDMEAVSIRGNLTPTVGEVATYTVTIKNNDAQVQDNYFVKLMGPNDVVLASVAGPSIGSLETLEVSIPWTPTAAGAISIYGKVERAGDEFAANDQTEPMQLLIQPEGVHAITIGTGDRVSNYPMNFTYYNSLHQSLYFADELGFGAGIITSMTLYNRFYSLVFDTPTQVYLASTDLENLDGGWFDASDMVLVYDGEMEFPAGENAVNINFQIPYVHTGGNLVVMFHRPMDTRVYSSSNYFRSQLGSVNRARYYSTNRDAIDPFDPPEGTVSAYFPQATFFYSAQAVENDLFAWEISGEDAATVGIETSYTVRIKNNGTAAQDDYSVKIMGPGEVELASIAGPPINSMQVLDVVVPWTPTTEGHTLIYGKVVLSGDEVAQNDETRPLEIHVQPGDTQTVTIGTGDTLARYPVDFYFRGSLYQAIYMQDELGFTSGTITSLAVYNNFATDRPDGTTKIYLGSTGEQELSTGFIPATELTLVYDGNVDYPSGENTITIHLQTPYEHVPGNLVMMWYRPLDIDYTSNEKFKCQRVNGLRAHYMFGWGSELDPMNPENGMALDILPMITFSYTEESVENDLGAMTISGTELPTVGVPSNYTIKVRNHGSEAQDNYTVKIMGPGEAELASVAGPPIGSMETVEIVIPWAPTTPGNYDIYGKIELDGDEFDANNRTANHNLWVNPAGVHAVTIGAGNEYAVLPVHTNRMNSLFQTLYYPDEIVDISGDIAGLRFYTDFGASADNVPLSIWLGSTTNANLSSGWIPSTQLTQVFDGIVNFESGYGTANITFDRPYTYTGEDNLVMMIYKASGEISYGMNYFKCQTLNENRCRYIYSDNVVYDPAAPPYVSPSAQFPMTTFMIEAAEMSSQIFGTVTGKNNLPLADVTISVDDGLYTTTTNVRGDYSLNVPVGTYTVTASADEYHSQTVVDVAVYFNQPAMVNFALTHTPTDDPHIPVVATALNGNYPNPFNPETTITYSIREPGRVRLDIYNIKGQLVRTLVDEDHAAGHYKKVYNARDSRGRPTASGVYLIRMSAPGYQKTSKMILMQ